MCKEVFRVPSLSSCLDLDWNEEQASIWLILTVCDLGLFSLNC